jgi:hypothetical protein
MSLKNGRGLEVAGFTPLTTDELRDIQGGGIWGFIKAVVKAVNDLINGDDDGGGCDCDCNCC